MRFLFVFLLVTPGFLFAQLSICTKDGKSGLCKGETVVVTPSYDLIGRTLVGDGELFYRAVNAGKKMRQTEWQENQPPDAQNWVKFWTEEGEDPWMIRDLDISLFDSTGKELLSHYSGISRIGQFWFLTKNGKYGLATSDGKIILNAECIFLAPFYHHGSEDLLGFIANQGGIISYQEATDSIQQYNPYDESIEFVLSIQMREKISGGNFMIFDRGGHLIADKVEKIRYLNAADDYERERVSYIMVDLSEDVPVKYISRTGFYNFARAPLSIRKNGRWTGLFPDGRSFMETGLDSLHMLSWGDSNCLRTWHDGKCGLFTAQGTQLLPVSYHHIIPDIRFVYINDTARVLGGFVSTSGPDGSALFTHDLKPIVRKKEGLIICRELNDSVFIFVSEGRSGVIRLDGKTIIPCAYDLVDITDEGFRCCNNPKVAGRPDWKDYKSGPDYYGYTYHFSRDTCACAWYDKSGKKLRDHTGYDESRLQSISYIADLTQSQWVEHNWYRVSKGKKCGALDLSGNLVLPVKYEDIGTVMTSGQTSWLWMLKKNGKYALASQNGKPLTGFRYNSVYPVMKFPDDAAKELLQKEVLIATAGGNPALIKKLVSTEEIDINTGLPVDKEIMVPGFLHEQYYLIDLPGKELAGPFDSLYVLHEGWLRKDELAAFIYRVGKKYGVTDSKGTLLTAAEYDTIINLYSGLSVVKEGLNGLLDMNGQLKLPFVYDKYSIEHMTNFKGYFSVKKKGRLGVASMKKEIATCAYDEWVSGDQWITGDNFLVMGVNDKKYVYSLLTGELITPGGVDFILAGPMNTLLFNKGGKGEKGWWVKKMPEGGKWGLASKNGRLLIPILYDELSPPNPDAGIYSAVKYLPSPVTEYYDSLGNPLPDGAKLWKASFIGKLSVPFVKKNYTWGIPSGPEGADLTAFVEDKKGNYWIGTGSSGGVYVSSDKGRIWKERNKGIGPVDVQVLQFHGDTLFMAYAPNGYEESGEEIDPFSYSHMLTWYDERTTAWVPVPDSLSWTRIRTMFEMVERSREELDGKLEIRKPDHDHGEYFLTGFEFNMPSGYQQLAGFGKAGSETPGFPRDVFSSHHPCITERGKGAFLLGKSALYAYDGAMVTRFPQKGLHASDITEIIPVSGGYFVKSGMTDIWFFDGTNWKKLLDTWNELRESKRVSHGGYAIHTLEKSADDKILFTWAGGLWEMDRTGKKKLLLGELEVKDDKGRMHYFNPVSGVISPNDKQVLTGIIYRHSRNNYQGRNFYDSAIVYRHDLRTGITVYNDTGFVLDNNYSHSIFPTVRRSPDGKVWFLTGGRIYQMDQKGNLFLSLALKEGSFMHNSLSFRSDGCGLVTAGNNQAWYYDAKDGNWHLFYYPGPGRPEIFGFDEKGDIYASFNYSFDYGCGGKNELSKPGFYRLYFSDAGAQWEPVPSGPNPRILSIAPHPKGLLLGTSGSGAVVLEVK